MPEQAWDIAVSSFIDYRNRKLNKAKLKRAEALETRKALAEEIKGLSDGEKKKKADLAVDYFDCDTSIKSLKMTITECQTDIRKAIDHADQPELFPEKPHGALKIKDEEPEPAEQPELIAGAGPKGKTKRAELGDGPRLAQA